MATCPWGAANRWIGVLILGRPFRVCPKICALDQHMQDVGSQLKKKLSDYFRIRLSIALLSIQWYEWCFKPHLCTYRLHWAKCTSCGWWEEWDDSVLQRQDSKFQPWRSGAEFAISRFRSSQYWIFTSEQGRNILFLWNLNASAGFETAISDFPSRPAAALYPR